MKDFFISYTGADRAWAEWVAWQLEAQGYGVVIQAWDFHAGGNFVLDMKDAAANSERTIAILSPNYLKSLYAQAEWAAAFAKDPTGVNKLLVPIRIAECELNGLDKTIVYIDLLNKSEDEAKQALLNGVSRGRAKPELAPAFPGSKEGQSAPPFPPSTHPTYDPDQQIRTALTSHIKNGPKSWTIDPILHMSRQTIPYCKKYLTESRIPPLLAAMNSPFAFILGDVGVGKTALLAHLSQQQLGEANHFGNWILPLDTNQMLSLDYEKNTPFHTLQQIVDRDFDLYDGLWQEGKLWLYFDNVTPSLQSNFGFLNWVRTLKLQNDEKGLTNRIWLNAKGEIESAVDDYLSGWQKLTICPPNESEIWQYMQDCRGIFPEQWSRLYNHWLSPSSSYPLSNLLGLNIFLKISLEHQSSQIVWYDLKKASQMFLGYVFPDKSKVDYEEINWAMVEYYKLIWKEESENFWMRWNRQFDKRLLTGIIEKSGNDKLGSILSELFSQGHRNEFDDKYVFLAENWIIEALQDIWRSPEGINKDSMITSVVGLLKNQNRWNLASLLLYNITNEEFRELLLTKIESEFLDLIDKEERANILHRFLWKVLYHFRGHQQAKTVDLLNQLNDWYPQFKLDSIDEKTMAVDQFAWDNKKIPKEIVSLLPESLVRRYEKLRILFSTETGLEVQTDLLKNTEHWHEWLEYIKCYPKDCAVRQLLKICFDYRTSIDPDGIDKLLETFKVYLDNKAPGLSDNIRSWVEQILRDPQVKYNSGARRTVVLLKHMGNVDQLCNKEFARKLYRLGVEKEDIGLRDVAFIYYFPEPMTEDDKGWLLTAYKNERASNVKTAIIEVVARFQDVKLLELIMSDEQSAKQIALCSCYLYMHYQRNHRWNEIDDLILKVQELSIIRQLSSVQNLPVKFAEGIVRLYVTQAKRDLRYLSLEDAIALIDLYNDSDLTKLIKDSLLITERDKEDFVSYRNRSQSRLL